MILPIFESQSANFAQRLEARCRASEPDATILEQVGEILRAVRDRGDAAVREYTRRFDQHDAPKLEIDATRLAEAERRIPASLRDALRQAEERVRDFHRRQKQESWSYLDSDGNTLGQRVSPLQRAGVYVPGGKAAYPSSVLMNVVPARVAGVEEIVMTAPAPGGELSDAVLAAAHIAGVHRAFAIGGAQAVAAMAWGTETIPRVDKIVGPGNIWVTTAKRLVFGNVGIDMLAGPSEVLIMADASADPDWLAMDMFAQLEHDELASALLVSPESELLEEVRNRIERRLPEMARAAIIRAALSHSALVHTPDLDTAVDVVNRIAPEHLELALDNPESILNAVRNAGAIFVGHWSAEVLGDYCAGPNHVLPTGGTARFSSALSVHDFQKFSSLVHCAKGSVRRLAELAATLADHEQLSAHACSARLRLRTPQGDR